MTAMATARGTAADDDLLLTAEVSAITRLAEGTLRRWRNLPANPGPKGFKVGPKVWVYRRSEVTRWLAEQETAAKAS